VVGSGVVRSGVGFVSGSRVVRSGSGVVDGSGLGVVRSGFGSIRSGVMDGFGVVRSGSGMVGLVVGFAFVFDISNVSVFVVSGVGDNLGSAVGEGHTVFTGHHTVVILSFLLAEVGARVFILDSVFVGKRPGRQLVFGSGMVRSGLVNWWVVGSGFGSVIGSGSGVVGSGSGMIRSGMVRSNIGESHGRKGQH